MEKFWPDVTDFDQWASVGDLNVTESILQVMNQLPGCEESDTKDVI